MVLLRGCCHASSHTYSASTKGFTGADCGPSVGFSSGFSDSQYAALGKLSFR